MLLGIVVGILAVGIIWGILDTLSDIAEGCRIVGGLLTVLCSLVFIVNNVGIKGAIQSNKTRYEMLKYQYENEFYENDNDVGKYQLIEDIREWNEDLAMYKAIQHDLWIGIFVPDIYDQFEFIDITK